VHLGPPAEGTPGAAHGDGVDVRGVQFDRTVPDVGESLQESGPDRPRAAAEVDDHTGARRGGQRLVDEELAAVTRHEDRPAEHVLERLAGHPTADQDRQLGRRPGLGPQQARLVLGEDAAGGAKGGDEIGGRRGDRL
jgi:hypothetical protein